MLTIKPYQAISYQSHEWRAEHWVIIKGCAGIMLEGSEPKYFEAIKGFTMSIKAKQKHRIRNVGTGVLKIIEVQEGTLIKESDIKRYADDYGRVG